MVSLGFIVVIILIAIAAPVFASITGHPPNEQYRHIGLSPDGLPRPPSSTFWFGTDDLGRDVLVRVVYGARVSLGVGVLATAPDRASSGVVVGLAAGYLGGWTDTVLARLIDLVLVLPFLLVAIALVSVFGSEPDHHHLRHRRSSAGRPWPGSSVVRCCRSRSGSTSRRPARSAPVTPGSCSSTSCRTCSRR